MAQFKCAMLYCKEQHQHLFTLKNHETDFVKHFRTGSTSDDAIRWEKQFFSTKCIYYK